MIRKQATVVLYGHGQSGVDVGVLEQDPVSEPALVTPVGASGAFDADGRPVVYRAALGLLEAGGCSVAPFITHRYHSLDAVPGAFGGEHREPGYMKGVVKLRSPDDADRAHLVRWGQE